MHPRFQKPPFGAELDLAHPLSTGLLAALLFNEVGISMPGYLRVVQGTTIVPGQPVPVLDCNTDGTPPVWKANAGGPALLFVASDQLHINSGPTVNTRTAWLPTTACTVLLIRRKTDTTLRSCTAFGLGDTPTDALRLGAHVPYSDGTVYWDFGGTSSPNRLTVAGLSFAAVLEKWAFTAGPEGSAIWRDGVKLASQSTAITRTQATAAAYRFFLNSGNGLIDGDIQEVNFFAVYKVQWNAAQVRQWAAEPYAMFKLRVPISYFIPTMPAVSAGVSYPRLERGIRGLNRGMGQVA